MVQASHHEQNQASQKHFAKQVNALVHVINDIGNPFEEVTKDLLRLHSKNILDQEAVKCLTTIQLQGQEQYRAFLEERLKTRTKPITAPSPGTR